MKLLYRCLIAHRSIKRVRSIFKLYKKRNSLMSKFQQTLADGQEANENDITQFCIACSRIFTMTKEFLDENSYFDRFMYKGQELGLQMQYDMLKTKTKY